MATCSFGRSHGPILTTLFPSASLTALHSTPHSVLSLQSIHSPQLPHNHSSQTNPLIQRVNQLSHNLRELPNHHPLPLPVQPAGILEVSNRSCTPNIPRSISGLQLLDPVEDLASSGEEAECLEIPKILSRPSSKNTQNHTPSESSDARTL
ncbi:UNVERIFIED_CONTAM: hypothetical protein RMT77_018593 [Armadillidium vulgare]